MGHGKAAGSFRVCLVTATVQILNHVEPADCFVVVNCHGECWDGESWVELWSKAMQFRRPSPAYELCEQAARDAERITGVAGAVCYIPPGTPASLALSPFPDLSQVELRTLALALEAG